MNKILKLFIPLLLLSGMGVQFVFGQCTVPVQPINVTVVETGAGTVQVEWDIDCAGRVPGPSSCTNADPSSIFWYVGAYSHSSPAANGLIMEYASGTFYEVGCDNTIVRDGGGTVANCFDPKGSTCRDQEVGQLFSGGGSSFATRPGTFSAEDICTADVFGVGVGRAATVISGLCEGASYDIYVWEIISDRPPNFDPGTPANGDKSSMAHHVACGLSGVIAESPASVVQTVDLTGTLGVISPPVLTVAGATTCGGDGNYSSTHQTEPDVTILPGCTTTTDVLIGASTLAADTLISGDIAGGTATLGANVVQINCRDQITLALPTPTGCKGIIAMSPPFCDPSITTTSNAAVYMYSGGSDPLADIYFANTNNTFPACYAGAPASTNSCEPDTGSDNDFPNNYTASFGNFIQGGTGCSINVSGNPFEGGLSPFELPGTYIGIPAGATDGVERFISTLCVRYEDDCNGTKSTTCVKFISDASPITLDGVVEVDESCAGAADGAIRLSGLVGGSTDPDRDGTLTGANYVFTPDPGFTQTAAGEWEATGLATGTYEITISDPNAAGCGSACDVEFTAVIRPKLPSTITGSAVVCPDQCVMVDALLTENPIVNYDITSAIDFSGGCAPGTTAPTTYPVTTFVNSTSSVAPPGGTCSTTIGTGSTDITLVDVCFEMTIADFSQVYVSLDNGADWEDLFVGTGFAGGTETGSGAVSFCASAPVGATYDGVLDGDAGGANFNGDDINNFVLFVRDLSGCENTVITSASVVVRDRCVEPQTAAICLAADDAINGGPLSWSFNSGPGPDLLDLTVDPNDESGEFCAAAATPAGDYIYDVSGFHIATGSSPTICCPASGQVTVEVLDVPPPPTIGGLVNGDEFCESDIPVDITITPPLDPTPGAVSLANTVAGDFGGSVVHAVVYEGPGAGGAAVGVLHGQDFIADPAQICAGLTAGYSGTTLSNLAPGDYTVVFANFGNDGLNDNSDYEVVDQCGNVIATAAEAITNGVLTCGTTYSVDFTIAPEQLVVSGPGVVQTSNPDGIANNGDETYHFDPGLANLAATDGSACNENLVTIEITSSCGCIVEEEIEVSVYDEPTATDPTAKTVGDCAGDLTVTYTSAEILAGVSGGTGSYLMTYVNPVTGAVVGPTPVADVTLFGNGQDVVLTITDADALYTASYTDSDAATQNCDGNGCSTTLVLTIPSCPVDCDAGTATSGTPILCIGEDVSISDMTAMFDHSLASDDPGLNQQLGYAFTAGSGSTVTNQADINAAPLVVAATPTDGAGPYTTTFVNPTGAITAPGVYSVTPFISTETITDYGPFNAPTIGPDGTALLNTNASYYFSTLPEFGCLNAGETPTSLSVTVTINNFINNSGCTSPGTFFIDAYVNGTTNAEYTGDFATGPLTIGSQLSFDITDFSGYDADQSLSVQVSPNWTSGGGAPADCNTPGALDAESDYFLDYTITVTAVYSKTFPSLAEGSCCGDIGTPTDIILLDDIVIGTVTVTEDCDAETYEVTFTPTGGAPGLNGTTGVSFTAEYGVTAVGSTSVSPAGNGDGATTGTGTGAFTLTYPIGTDYSFSVANVNASDGSALISNDATNGCPVNDSGTSPVKASTASTTSGFSLCQGETIGAGAGLLASCGVGSNATWYEDAAGTVLAGTGAIFAPSSYGGTPVENLAPGAYTFYVQCSTVSADCPSDLSPVDLTVVLAPIAEITCPAVTIGACKSGIINLAQNDGNAVSLAAGSTGVFSGTAAPYMQGDPNPGGGAFFDPSSMPVGIPLTLIYTVTSTDGCTDQVSCTFTITNDLEATSGKF